MIAIIRTGIAALAGLLAAFALAAVVVAAAPLSPESQGGQLAGASAGSPAVQLTALGQDGVQATIYEH